MTKKLIETWEDLVGLENDEYYLEIDTEMGNGHIRFKHPEDHPDGYEPYLSTHTFYGKSYQYSSILLQEHGFDVMIKNWDGKTEEVSAADQWLYDGKCSLCRRSKYCHTPCKKYKSRVRDEIRMALYRRHRRLYDKVAESASN